MEDQNKLRGIKVYERPIAPNGKMTVESFQWPIAERVTVYEAGQPKSVLKAPSVESPKRWLPGTVSDLKVIVNWVEFDDGEVWNCPATYKFFYN